MGGRAEELGCKGRAVGVCSWSSRGPGRTGPPEPPRVTDLGQSRPYSGALRTPGSAPPPTPGLRGPASAPQGEDIPARPPRGGLPAPPAATARRGGPGPGAPVPAAGGRGRWRGRAGRRSAPPAARRRCEAPAGLEVGAGRVAQSRDPPGHRGSTGGTETRGWRVERRGAGGGLLPMKRRRMNKLYIGNLSPAATAEDLKQLFGERKLPLAGQVLLKSGYAFVDYPDQNWAIRAIETLSGEPGAAAPPHPTPPASPPNPPSLHRGSPIPPTPLPGHPHRSPPRPGSFPRPPQLFPTFGVFFADFFLRFY